MADVQIKCVSFRLSVQKALRSMERERCQTPRAAAHWPVGARLSTRSNILRCHEAFCERHSRRCIAISCRKACRNVYKSLFQCVFLWQRKLLLNRSHVFKNIPKGSHERAASTVQTLLLHQKWFFFFLMQPFPNSKKFEGGHTTVWTEKQSQGKKKKTFMHWCAPFWIWGRIEVLLPHSTRSHGHTCTSNTTKRVKEIHTCDLVIVCLQRCFHVS